MDTRIISWELDAFLWQPYKSKRCLHGFQHYKYRWRQPRYTSYYVTDFEFSPFDDHLLATGSSDTNIKVWVLPTQEDINSGALSSLNASASFANERRVENVTWNPVADGVLAASVFDTIKVYDVERGDNKYTLGCHGDQIQSVSWRGSGTTLVTSCKDKNIRVLDPRSGGMVLEGRGHGGVKDTRALWLGDKDFIVSTGFSSDRSQEIRLWDSRSFRSCLHSIDIGNSTGTVMPFYDSDTSMLFFIGKGENQIKYCELTDKSPFINENFIDRTEQIKGAAMVPKRLVNVMEGEVNRLLILTSSAIIPTPYIVPRKSYRDYHEDLYPDTFSGEPTLSSSSWLSGQNGQVKLMTLNPSRRSEPVSSPGHIFQANAVVNGSISRESTPAQKPVINKPKPVSTSPPSVTTVSSAQTTNIPDEPEDLVDSQSVESTTLTHNQTDEEKEEIQHSSVVEIPPVSTPSASSGSRPMSVAHIKTPVKVFSTGRLSKFKFLKGRTEHKDKHIVNIRKLSTTVPGESDMFAANRTRCVVPVEGAGGLLQVLEFARPGRLQDTGLPVLQHKSKVLDYVWDPYDDSRLVVACDDAKIWVWNIPEGGLTETLTEASLYLQGHMEKIYFVRFHPLAKDIIVSSAYDMSVRIWDLSSGTEVLQLQDHPDQVFNAAWSPDGKYLSTVCKDGKLRIFNPRKYQTPLMEGQGPAGARGARLTWVLDGQYLLVTGFSDMNERIISLYDTADLATPLQIMEVNAAPPVLVPYYDEDSHTVFLSSRGENQLYAYEVSDEEPYITQLSNFAGEGLHQAFSFLPKITCNPKEVEFARAWRLTSTSLEPISFTVPRVKMEYFQDDLFPDTRVTWEPTMTSDEWLSGLNNHARTISLQPRGMKKLSEAPVEAPKASKYDSYNPDTYKTDEQKKEELLSAMTNKLSVQGDPLPQDLAEGVDSDEWEDE
ncbi:coronin-7-like isoform X2 [Mizuhopecten yessoensis]|uniref:coronin-7-like isoform X2 n=1 Tax=Mizuhopecten yessoensis TaxID=6573 RepID=UPI000B4589B4|nr:coronin-7-like isoform X2 [Mizuhopecten yessoensis]